MPDLEGVGSYITFRHLGGTTVTPDQVASEIVRWPLDGVLGFLGALSLEALHAGRNFSDPRRQGDYLNWAIVDDFPRMLPRAFAMYVPGRVPITGRHHVLVHEQNMAWLSHVALLHAREGLVTPGLSYELRRRMFRLLLIVNDFFSGELGSVPSNLTQRRAFALDWLRHGQFNRFFENSAVTMLKLARQRILMLEILSRFFDVESAFRDATNGVSLQKYFEILTMFVTHIHHEMAPDKRWLSRDGLCATVRGSKDEVEVILGSWIRTPD
ncbi:MAG: hypothetical protein ACREOH_13005, partial [Candidatus Entotheonellia bacterium]